jgi:hypothetical protein
LPAAVAASASAFVSGAAAATDAIAVATALARRAEVKTVLADIRCLRSILGRARIGHDRNTDHEGCCYSANVHENVFSTAVKSPRHVIALIRSRRYLERRAIFL